MAFRLSTNSTDAWDMTLRAIQTAVSSIYIEMYIFNDDTNTTHDFVSALIERANAGVQIIMILDAFGSIELKAETLSRFKTFGIEVRFFRHWIHRTHRKTIIIDGSRAFVGGVNIAKHAASWSDLQIEVSGIIVHRLVKVFTRTYKLSKGKQILKVPARQLHKHHRLQMWILEHTPIASKYTLKKYYLTKLAHASKRITFITPYFIPHQWLLDAMKQAIDRGVVVELLIPYATDSRIIDTINNYYATIATRLGVIVYIIPTTNHAKAVLIDDTEGLVGSGNIDSLSFDRNSELGIFFKDKDIVAELSHIIAQWKSSAHIWGNTLSTKLPWYYVPFIPIVKLIHSFL